MSSTNAGNLVSRVFTPSSLHFSALPPLGLYIHLPWCVRKCPYCDFNSHVAQSDSPKDHGLSFALQRRYVDALILDLDQQLPKIWGRRLYSVFIGGGTPSLFDPVLLDELLGAVRARLGSPQSGEITMEANPGTFEQERFEGFRQAGVNRLSIGVQSFSDAHLKALGRIHQGEQAKAAVASAVRLFPEVNVDLMYGLPHQTIDQALVDVQQAIDLQPTHLSLYQLTLEPNTLFAQKPPPMPSDDDLIDIEEAVHAQAAQAGYLRYEISAFSKAGHRCAHNLNYWTFGDYLGIGAGAHAKISYPNRIEREIRHRNPQAYMDEMHGAAQPAEVRTLAVKDLPFEFMLNALRLMDGVPEVDFTERCGRPIADMQRALNTAVNKGLLEASPGVLKPTELGFRFLNDVQQLFLADTA